MCFNTACVEGRGMKLLRTFFVPVCQLQLCQLHVLSVGAQEIVWRIQIHFVQFPRDPAISREWVKFVTFTRQVFTFSARSRPLICSAHFSEDCTEPSNALKISLGLTSKFRLKPGSIPTLKAPNIEVSGPKSTTSATASTTTSAESSASSSTGSARSQKSQSGAAFQKRERSRVRSCCIKKKTIWNYHL